MGLGLDDLRSFTLIVALGVLPPILAGGSAACAYSYWFVVLGVITWIRAATATTENVALTGGPHCARRGLHASGHRMLGAPATVLAIGVYQLISSALLAWHLAGAMVLNVAFGRPVLTKPGIKVGQ